MDVSKTRHGVLANDSVRVCVILPRSLKEQIDTVAADKKRTMSEVIRGCVIKGINNVK